MCLIQTIMLGTWQARRLKRALVSLKLEKIAAVYYI